MFDADDSTHPVPKNLLELPEFNGQAVDWSALYGIVYSLVVDGARSSAREM